MSTEQILVIEDDRLISDSLRYSLVKEGYTALVAADGETGLKLAREEKPDLVILDLMLPKRDGRDVCKTLRAESAVPIIILTARGDEIDKVLGLELGADDYLVKPFGLRELIARIRAHLRRVKLSEQPVANPPCLEVGAILLDPNSHRVLRENRQVEMTRKEYDLLRALMENAGRVVARQDLIDRVWSTDWIGDTRTLDVHIRWLREKIEADPSSPEYIQTVRGVGYRFVSGDEWAAR